MTNVKKKDGKWFGAIVLSLILLFSLVFPYPVMADQTAADQTTAASVYAIHKTGDDKENFVIVIMGEGYTREQQEQFLKDATAKAQGLLKWSPYKEYSDRINIYAVQTVSNETGVACDVYGVDIVGGDTSASIFMCRHSENPAILQRTGKIKPGH